MEHAIILFDGVCNFCDATVHNIIKRDKKNIFQFASLQSIIGQKILQENNLPNNDLKTIYVIEGKAIFAKWDAIVQIAKHIKGFWLLAYILKPLPKLLQNKFYDIVAKNRYTLFGKKNECKIPDAYTKAKFLA